VDGAMAVAVGPNGEDVTKDFGVTWEHTDSLNLNAVFILDVHYGWAVGPKGTIARFLNQKQYTIRNALPKELDPCDGNCKLLDVAGLSTLPRLLQLDSPPSLPEGGASASPTELGGSFAGRRHAIHSN
jgi:hypothetical protein